MNDKFERTLYGTIFALRLMGIWRMRVDGILSEEDFLMGVLVMFIGIAARRMKIIGIVAGGVANLALGIFILSDWRYGKYFLGSSLFLVGLLVGKVFFRPGFYFALGQVLGCLVTLISMYGQELWGDFTIEISVLVVLSVLQSIFYYYSIKCPKKKLKNTLVQYYSSYPPLNLSAFLLYFSYFFFFIYYSSLLISLIKFSSTKYLPIFYLSTNLVLFLFYTTINFLFLTSFYKSIKQRLLIGLLGLSLIFPIPIESDPVFLFSLIFIHYLWNTINEFDLYVYGKNKSACHLWICSAALGGSIFPILSLLFPTFLQIFNYVCSVFTFAVFSLLTLNYTKLHPHPSFLPLMYEVEHITLHPDCPYTIRKRIQQELLNKLI